MPNEVKLTGWICPKCGRGLAPWVRACDCLDYDCKPLDAGFKLPENPFTTPPNFTPAQNPPAVTACGQKEANNEH